VQLFALTLANGANKVRSNEYRNKKESEKDVLLSDRKLMRFKTEHYGQTVWTKEKKAWSDVC
jgi:hypothetical protein